MVITHHIVFGVIYINLVMTIYSKIIPADISMQRMGTHMLGLATT